MHLAVCLQVIARESLATATALLLAYVIQIGVAEEAHSTEEESQVAFPVVVERVGFVPVGERARVLMG